MSANHFLFLMFFNAVSHFDSRITKNNAIFLNTMNFAVTDSRIHSIYNFFDAECRKRD